MTVSRLERGGRPVRLGTCIKRVGWIVVGMADSDASIGLVACTECGTLQSARRPDGESERAPSCQQCGNDSFEDIRDPSTL